MNDYLNESKEKLIKLLKEKDSKIAFYKEKIKFGGLVWQAKSENAYEKLKENHIVLENIDKKNLNFKTDRNSNILIEGDNLHALSVLNYSHKECIDIIYIDPPYNIGSRSKPDFYYDDKRVDEDDPFRHSKWISFMYKRLKLARELLKDNGIIYISIDETEINNLKLLCDEIFGWRNFLSNIKLKVKAGAGVGSKDSFLQDVVEYILVYKKKLDIQNNIPDTLEIFKSEEEQNYTSVLIDKKKIKKIKDIKTAKRIIPVYEYQKYKISSLKKDKRNKENYIKYFDKIFRTTNPQGGLMKEILPEIPKKGLFSFETMNTKGKYKGQKTTKYVYNGGLVIFFKEKSKIEKGNLYRFIPNSNLWLKNYHQGIAKEGSVVFKNGKKPVKLIKDLINMVPNNHNATILDFFAGSGTTGQAAIELNKEDGGNRNYILNTNNEDQGYGKIMDKFCYPRLSKISKDYKSNLHFYKTKFIKKIKNDKEKVDLFKEIIDLICIKENTFKKILSGKDNKYCLYESSTKIIGFIFDDDFIEDFNKFTSKFNKKINVYIFSYENVNYSNFFKDNKKNITAISLPHSFLKEAENVSNSIKMDYEEN